MGDSFLTGGCWVVVARSLGRVASEKLPESALADTATEVAKNNCILVN